MNNTLNKEINTPNFTVRQLINIFIIIVIAWFVFGNHTSDKYLRDQNKNLIEKYEVVEKYNHKLDGEILELKKFIRKQDFIDSTSNNKLKKVRKRSIQKQRDYEKAINNINNLNERQLDSTIEVLLK